MAQLTISASQCNNRRVLIEIMDQSITYMSLDEFFKDWDTVFYVHFDISINN